MSSLNEKVIDFKTTYQEIFKFVRNFVVNIIKEMIESIDKALLKERDIKVCRHKRLKKNTIKTVMGSVEYKRSVYEHLDAKGTK